MEMTGNITDYTIHMYTIQGKRGKPHLQQNIQRYNEAARHSHWIVVVDLDHDADCAPALQAEWLPSLAPTLGFRITVGAIETWFLASSTHS
jgi:hypothetical protein